MITREDAILALSWSGETAELGNIVYFPAASPYRWSP